MFYFENATAVQREMYEEMLQITGSLSKLFSDNDRPYLVSRLTENLFCKYLHAENLSRSDITADAKKENVGVGIKTWVGGLSQKIAEFNRDRPSYADLNVEDKVFRIAELRNDRIAFTMRVQDLDAMMYHCTVRDVGLITICECPLIPIDMESIQVLSSSNSSIVFRDDYNSYSFNLSKSTLYKTFDDLTIMQELPVEILADPYAVLYDIFHGGRMPYEGYPIQEQELFLERAYLPLYSSNRYGKYVPPRNNLNMRFAGGRRRDIYEIGIPCPAAFRRLHPDFFPGLQPFDLQLPNGVVLSVKRCQQEGKSLMSNPNSALGHWLIDDVLQMSPEMPITYEMLAQYGIDAVQIDKIYHIEEDRIYYKMNFSRCGAYETYMGVSVSEEE